MLDILIGMYITNPDNTKIVKKLLVKYFDHDIRMPGEDQQLTDKLTELGEEKLIEALDSGVFACGP